MLPSYKSMGKISEFSASLLAQFVNAFVAFPLHSHVYISGC